MTTFYHFLFRNYSRGPSFVTAWRYVAGFRTLFKHIERGNYRQAARWAKWLLE